MLALCSVVCLGNCLLLGVADDEHNALMYETIDDSLDVDRTKPLFSASPLIVDRSEEPIVKYRVIMSSLKSDVVHRERLE